MTLPRLTRETLNAALALLGLEQLPAKDSGKTVLSEKQARAVGLLNGWYVIAKSGIETEAEQAYLPPQPASGRKNAPRKAPKRIRYWPDELEELSKQSNVLAKVLDNLGDEAERILVNHLFPVQSSRSKDISREIDEAEYQLEKFRSLKDAVNNLKSGCISATNTIQSSKTTKRHSRPVFQTPSVSAWYLAVLWEDVTRRWPGRVHKNKLIYRGDRKAKFSKFCDLMFNAVSPESKSDHALRQALSGKQPIKKAEALNSMIHLGAS